MNIKWMKDSDTKQTATVSGYALSVVMKPGCEGADNHILWYVCTTGRWPNGGVDTGVVCKGGLAQGGNAIEETIFQAKAYAQHMLRAVLTAGGRARTSYGLAMDMLLVEGGTVLREGWVNGEGWLHMSEDKKSIVRRRHLVSVSWLPTMEDMLATDWVHIVVQPEGT